MSEILGETKDDQQLFINSIKCIINEKLSYDVYNSCKQLLASVECGLDYALLFPTAMCKEITSDEEQAAKDYSVGLLKLVIASPELVFPELQFGEIVKLYENNNNSDNNSSEPNNNDVSHKYISNLLKSIDNNNNNNNNNNTVEQKVNSNSDSDNKWMQVFVKDIDGRTITVDCKTKYRVDQFKASYLTKPRTNLTGKHFIFCGKELQPDNSTLKDHHITGECTLYAVTRRYLGTQTATGS